MFVFNLLYYQLVDDMSKKFTACFPENGAGAGGGAGGGGGGGAGGTGGGGAGGTGGGCGGGGGAGLFELVSI